ncbi:SDR family NAD(P)-dependent oxidoreductase [Puia dinghuensis]|uniref:Short-chain dehydrogenase n=1 Tax=Puia dinghuensis TaxID=1792502 RepID=A0A8J2UC52_9BACT|nr:SDR family oxidoreductase [Puia dinghuensis]GGA96080.1 short-chain dehydrogenase [Puia dinghuensis]
MNRLKDKVAVVYGNGAIGSTIAKAFAHEGAKVFLTGLTWEKLKAIADDIAAEGGAIEIAKVDALDEQSVEKHMNEVIKKTGQIDISFNAIGLPPKDIQHTPLTELPLEQFILPIATYTQAHFITARAAAKRMMKQGRGVIIMHTANISQVSSPGAGGRPAAWAALEALCRSLSVECGGNGVRSICLLTSAIPETPAIHSAFKELFEVSFKGNGTTWEQFNSIVANNTPRKKLTTLKELTDAAVFAASDEGSAITGTTFNLTAGMIQ